MSATTLKRKDAPSRTRRDSFPQAKSWHADAPVSIVEAAQWDAGSPGWKAWQQHLAERERPIPAALIGSDKALLWGSGSLDLDQDDLLLAATLVRAARESASAAKAAAEQLPMWLRNCQDEPLREPATLEAIGWVQTLPALSRALPAERWWELVARLLELTDDPPAGRLADDPLTQQLLLVELPLTLAWMLPELAPCHTLAARAQLELEANLSAAADHARLVSAAELPRLRARLASWLRSAVIARHLSGYNPSAVAKPLATVLTQALRFTAPSGRQALDRRNAADRPAEMFQAALKEIDDPQVTAAATSWLAGLPVRRAKRKPSLALPASAWHSEDVSLGLLRRNWTADGELLAVRYDDRLVRCELLCGRETFWSGVWSVQLHLDGNLLEQRSDWDHVCWVSDDDVDYLELEARFTGGVRVQRQMLLARADRLLFLSDAVLGQAEGELDYRGVLPLDPGIAVQPAMETQEIVLAGRRKLSVQPLALPEWRRDPRGGSLSASDAGLRLQQRRTARRMYAPLLIDLNPRRAKQPLTWRQLTVAEDRRTVLPEIAVGYRAQIGRQQWLIYRALGERANRTVLGSNLVSEFMFARFSAEGEAEPLLEIE